MKDEEKALRKILEQQKQLLSQYEAAVMAYEASDVIQENNELKRRLEELKESYEEQEKNYKKVKEEAESLRWTLQEQFLSEKMTLLTHSEKKLNAYVKEGQKETEKLLSSFEQEMKCHIETLQSETKKGLEQEAADFRGQIASLNEQIKESVSEKQRQLKAQEESLDEQVKVFYQDLKDQPISPEVMGQRIKQNNIEVKIGLNWINKVGMLLILVGIVSVMRYSFKYFFSDEIKGIFGFLAGIAFLLGGEYCARKDKKVFAQGLIGGGIGIFYLTIFCSYFMLKIINIPYALGLAILVSATAFVLCLRYDSRTIACLALIGGYLPLIAYSIIDRGISGSFVYISMGYLLILNSVTLLISLRRNWPVLQYMSFFTNMPAAVVLAVAAEYEGAAIFYSFINFALYMLIMLAGPVKTGSRLSMGKVVIMGLNTVISCSVMWDCFIAAGLRQWMGLLALIFCLSFYGLNRMLTKLASNEKEVQLLFSITALTFAILTIPLQFGTRYITLGWLIEAVLLMTYGSMRNEKRLEIGGRIIFGICIATFYLIKPYQEKGAYYYASYTSMIAEMIWVLVMYLYPQRKAIGDGKAQAEDMMLYKYFTLLNVWFFLVTIGQDAASYYKDVTDGIFGIDMPIKAVLFSIMTVCVLMAMQYIPILYDDKVKHITFIGFCLVDLISVVSNCQMYVRSSNMTGDSTYHLAAVLLLIVWNILVLLNVNKLIRYIVVRNKLSVEVYPLAIAFFVIGNTTIIMGRQFELSPSSVIISIFYMISAFILVAVGFKFGYRWIRYWGLTLSVLALGKLFLFDFAMGVGAVYKIISYFSFGVILLIISYLYQKFSKRLERQLPAAVKREGEEHE